MLRATIFDIDGTLIDSVEQHALAWRQAFDDHGVDVPIDQVRRQIGKGADQLLPVFLDPAALKLRGPAIAAREGEIFQARFARDIRPFSRASDLFERLRQEGVKRVLASSGKPDDITRSKAIAGIENLVDVSVSSADVQNSKPEPDLVSAALDRLAPIAPAECVFIGDTPYDAEAAGRAGVKSIGVLSGCFDESELRAAGCATVFPDIAALLKDYGSIFGDS